MCNWQMKALEALSRLGGRDMLTAFPEQFYQKHPLENVRQGHCLDCGGSLGGYEMYPPGRTPRYLHDHCYRKIIRKVPKQFCLTCGEPLSREQIYAQMSNPGELTHALHPGLCEDYRALLAGIVLGVVPVCREVRMLPRYAGNRMIPFDRYPDPYQATSDVIDVEPLTPQRCVKVMKLLE